ncbi:MAG: hypothetical protein JZU55_08075, partial [Afipia sp.]|nr:hypothetical protein [Afipia sp.]
MGKVQQEVAPPQWPMRLNSYSPRWRGTSVSDRLLLGIITPPEDRYQRIFASREIIVGDLKTFSKHVFSKPR